MTMGRIAVEPSLISTQCLERFLFTATATPPNPRGRWCKVMRSSVIIDTSDVALHAVAVADIYQIILLKSKQPVFLK